MDLAEADLIVGTSAGAIIGAAPATGRDLGGLAVLPPDDGHDAAPDPDLTAEVFGVLGDPALKPSGALRRVGRLAVAARTVTEQTPLARMRHLISSDEWPGRPLLIPAVNIETGES